MRICFNDIYIKLECNSEVGVERHVRYYSKYIANISSNVNITPLHVITYIHMTLCH